MISYPLTRVQHEDVVTREYWDGDAQEYVNTKESMLAIKLWLETTTTEQKRIAYDSMTLLGDIGGLYDFIVVVVTPCVGLIVGDRLTYHLLSLLFMVNTSQAGGDSNQSDDNNSSDPDEKKKRWRSWLEETQPYSTSWRNQLSHNHLVSCITCRKFRRYRERNDEEKTLELGMKRVKRDLDIRNLIKAQDLLKTLVFLLVEK